MHFACSPGHDDIGSLHDDGAMSRPSSSVPSGWQAKRSSDQSDKSRFRSKVSNEGHRKASSKPKAPIRLRTTVRAIDRVLDQPGSTARGFVRELFPKPLTVPTSIDLPDLAENKKAREHLGNLQDKEVSVISGHDLEANYRSVVSTKRLGTSDYFWVRSHACSSARHACLVSWTSIPHYPAHLSVGICYNKKFRSLIAVLESRFKSSGHRGQKKHDGLFDRDHAFHRRWDDFVTENADILPNTGRTRKKINTMSKIRRRSHTDETDTEEEEESDFSDSGSG